MAEFRGSARSSGFNAIDLPDNAYRIKQAGQKRIDDLRNAYDQTIQNRKQNLADFQYDQSQVQSALKENQNLEETYRQTYEQALRKRYQQKLDKSAKQAEQRRSGFERLSRFSKEAGKIGAEMYNQYKEDRQREGMSLVFHTGLTAAELQTLRQQEGELLAEHTAANAIVERLKRNGASASEIKQIRELDGWILYGAQKELARTAGTAYHAHLRNPEVRNRKFKLSSGKELSLEEASRNLNEEDYKEIRGLLTSEFLKSYQGYDLAFAEEYIFPGMRKTKLNDDLDFASRLQEKFEQEEQQRYRTDLVNVLDQMESDEGALERFIITESGGDREAFGTNRKRVLQTIAAMIKDGSYGSGQAALNNLINQKFTIGGKVVTFGEQFLGKGKGGIDSPEIQSIRKALVDQMRFADAEEGLKEKEFDDQNLKAAIAQVRGDGLSDLEAQDFISLYADAGRSMPADLRNIVVSRSLPVDTAMQYQMAQNEIALGATFTEAQLAAKFPALSPTQRQQFLSAGNMRGSGNGSTGLKSYTDTLAQAIKATAGTSNQVDPGFMATGMIGLMKQEFAREFFERRNDTVNYGSYTDEQIARELMINYKDNLENGKGIFERIKDKNGNTVVGSFSGFARVTRPPIVDSPNWKNTIETIDNDVSVLSTKPLLGDINDPNSWASEIPEIIRTGKPPSWLTNLARYTNTSWKVLFNRQAALYGDYRLPLSRLEDAAEGISPGFRQSLGVLPTAAGVVMGSVTQTRAQGAQGLEVYRPLLNLIASYESSNDTVHGGYDAMNLGGTHGGSRAIGSNTGSVYFKKPLIEMTVGEIMDMQAAGQLHAAGRYQFLGSTLQDVFNRGNPGGISRDSLFDAATQDKLAVTYIRMTMRDFPGDPTSGIRGRWIGVKDNLTYEETQAIVNRIQQDTRVQGTAFANHEIDSAVYAHSANRK